MKKMFHFTFYEINDTNPYNLEEGVHVDHYGEVGNGGGP